MLTTKTFLKSRKFIVFTIILICAFIISAFPTIKLISEYKSYIEHPVGDINISMIQKSLDSANGYEIFKDGVYGVQVPLFILLIPLSVGVLFSIKYVDEKSRGYSQFIITRKKFDNYYFNSLWKCVSSSFIYIFIVLVGCLILSLVLFSATPPSESFAYLSIGGELAHLYYAYPMAFSFLTITHISFFASLFSMIAFSIAYFNENKFVVGVSGLGMFLFLMLVVQAIPFNLLYWYFPETFVKLLVEESSQSMSIGLQYLIHTFLYVFPTGLVIFLKYRKDRNDFL